MRKNAPAPATPFSASQCGKTLWIIKNSTLEISATPTPTATAPAEPGAQRRVIAYTYDGLNRLIGANERGATTNQYADGYDAVGNRTSATVNGVATAQTYNAANHVVGWIYDAAGNLLHDGTTARRSDALNRVLTQGSTSYASNGNGTRVAQTMGRTRPAPARPTSLPHEHGTSGRVNPSQGRVLKAES